MIEQVNSNTSLMPQSPFEQIKRVTPDGQEYWTGRDVMKVLGYANWAVMSPTYSEVYSSLCLENPSQIDMVSSFEMAQIGSGALRKVEDWNLSRTALNRVLSRVASYKPEAIRELRRQNEGRFRIEAEIGAILMDFCEGAGLSIVPQKRLENSIYDFCIAEKLLIEVDELHHKYRKIQAAKDARKTQTAIENGYKLLRIEVPLDNVAILCGRIVNHLLI
jgi:hypothetical protein